MTQTDTPCRLRTGSPSSQPFHPCSLVDHLTDQYERIASIKQRGRLTNIVECFRGQPAMFPLQCSETVVRLDDLRRAICHVQQFLSSLEPEMVQRLRPWGCIEKSSVLDSLLTEIILCVAMLALVCQTLNYERIDLHLYIRSLLPRALASYEDFVSQFAALIDQEMERRRERGSEDQ